MVEPGVLAGAPATANGFRDAYATRICKTLQSSSDIYSVAIHVASVLNDIAEVHTDTKLHLAVFW